MSTLFIFYTKMEKLIDEINANHAYICERQADLEKRLDGLKKLRSEMTSNGASTTNIEQEKQKLQQENESLRNEVKKVRNQLIALEEKRVGKKSLVF